MLSFYVHCICKKGSKESKKETNKRKKEKIETLRRKENEKRAAQIKEMKAQNGKK